MMSKTVPFWDDEAKHILRLDASGKVWFQNMEEMIGGIEAAWEMAAEQPHPLSILFNFGSAMPTRGPWVTYIIHQINFLPRNVKYLVFISENRVGVAFFSLIAKLRQDERLVIVSSLEAARELLCMEATSI